MVLNTLIASVHFFKGKPVFKNGSKILLKNAHDCPILCIWVFDNFIFAEEPFVKALQSLETSVLVDNDFYEKLVSSLELPITFNERFKVTSVPFFIPDLNLLSCQLNNLTLKVLYWLILYWYYIKTK